MADAGRHVLLLLDNASSHTVAGLEFTNVQVLFLPPNTTAELQPLDAGIISSFKRRYRRQHVEHDLYQDEQGEKSVYAVNQLQTMRREKQCWVEIDRKCKEALYYDSPQNKAHTLGTQEEALSQLGGRKDDLRT